MMKKIGNIGGIVSGIISVILAFVVKGMSIGSNHVYETYGGDAYTGIQNAASATANNLVDVADIVRTGVFAFLIVFGLALICFFVSRLNKDEFVIAKKETSENVVKEPVVLENEDINADATEEQDA